MAANHAVPAAVLPFVGEIRDVDTHDWTPVNHWVECYGAIASDFVEAVKASNFPHAAVRAADETELNAHTVWHSKRLDAPGAFDIKRRLDVMDFTGVHSQLLFPGGIGLIAVAFYANANAAHKFLPSITGDRRAYGMKLIEAYNDWCARVTRESARLRPVGVLVGDTLDDLTANCRVLLDKGIRGVWMPAAAPPAGLSPADPSLDPMWDMLQAAEAPLTSHIGADHGFLASDVWRKAPMFEGYKIGDEFSLDPWTISTFHRPTENFIQTIVLGGVFDRFPRLRYGASEFGAGWLGPCASMMDAWIQNSGIFKGEKHAMHLNSLPSEYFRRNIRVSPYDFEDIGGYIQRFGLDECYCYASDFPHVEGGKSPMDDFSRNLESSGWGPDVLHKFFVENGKLLLPN